MAVVFAGCNLPGISFEPDPPVLPPDMPEFACEPKTRSCTSGNTLLVCSDDGSDFDIRVCTSQESCVDGFCLPLQNTCEQGQPFSISASQVTFDVLADFKTQRQPLTLHNCGTAFLVLEQVAIRGPLRPDRTPVFKLTGAALQRQRLGPGESITLVVEYDPAPGLSQVVGSVDLGVITSGYNTYSIPIVTRNACTAITPRVNMNLVDPGTPHRVWLQNCGTEKQRFLSVESNFELLVGDEFPIEIPPGGHVGIDVLAPLEPGPFLGHVIYDTEKGEKYESQVSGHVVSSCGDFEVFAPEWVDATDHELPIVVRPRTMVRLTGTNPDDMSAHLRLDESPGGVRTQALNFGEQLLVRADWIGSYQVSQALVRDNEVSCERASVEFLAIPPDPLYVELTWENIGDMIPEDGGVGRGVNLDLHVSRHIPEISTKWTSTDDCHIHQMKCPGEGRVESTSWSGERPEVVSFQAPGDKFFEVGVHASNLFGYAGAGATVTVYANGQLVERKTALIQAADEFWVVGRYDAARQIWVPINAVFDGIPR